MPNELTDFVKNIPPVTRFLFFGPFVMSLLIAWFGLDFFYGTILTLQGLKDFQLWRLITAGINVGPPSFNVLMHMMFVYNYCGRLEQGQFANRRADFVYCVGFLWACYVVIGLLTHIPIFAGPLVTSLIYIWAQFNKDMIVSFFFGMRFKAIYLPWVMALLSMFLGADMISALIGIVVGHLYYFLEYLAPPLYGVRLLETPAIVHQYFDEPNQPLNATHAPPPAAAGAAPRPAPATGGYQWGRGNRLGDS